MPDKYIIPRCMGIARSHFLNTPYKDLPVTDLYQIGGFANKALGICHYCTIDTLSAILKKNCLRFTDVRFLNDSTEFIEVIPLIELVLSNGNYASDFKELILNSNEMLELKEYRQSYSGYSRRSHEFKQTAYHTYTCSFSTNSDSLSMWNYYATTAAGTNIVFNYAWNMFPGCNKTETNSAEILNNDIIIYRGLVLYSLADKKKCIAKLLDHLAEVFEDAKDELEKYKPHILYAFKESVNHMRCFFKNEAFSCEEEYRVVLKIPEEVLQTEESYGDIVDKGVFKRGNVLIPYIDYKFQKESIERITINPLMNEPDPMFELSIKHLLWTNMLQNVEIFHSGIPIRKYD